MTEQRYSIARASTTAKPALLRARCCPKEPARKVPRSIYEGARDMAREIAKSWEGRVSRRLRKKVEMLFAHLKRILKLDRLTTTRTERCARRVPPRSNRPEPPKACEADTDADPNGSLSERGKPRLPLT